MWWVVPAMAGAPKGGAAEWVDAGAGTFAAVAAADVRRVGLDARALPDGLRLHVGPVEKVKDRVEVLQGWPTPADPTVLVGAVALERGRLGDAELDAALRKAAGAHGGDLVVVTTEGYAAVQVGLVYHLGRGEPPADPRGAEAVIAASAAAGLPGYVATGAPVRQPLDATTPLAIEGERGTCYALAYASEAGSTFSAKARRVVAARTTVDGSERSSSSVAQWPTFRGATASFGCPQRDQPLSIEVLAIDGMNEAGATPHDLGEGELVLQLYTKVIGEADLARRAAEEAESLRAAHEASARLADQACGACVLELLVCGGDTHCSALNACLSTKGAHPSDCGF